jgi:hypothetical protein
VVANPFIIRSPRIRAVPRVRSADPFGPDEAASPIFDDAERTHDVAVASHGAANASGEAAILSRGGPIRFAVARFRRCAHPLSRHVLANR